MIRGLMNRERSEKNKKRIKTAGIFLLTCLLPLLLSGCAQTVTHLISPDETYEKEGAAYSDTSFRDKDSLYENDEAEIVTLYLTVGQGNEEEGTNHTWTEVNSHSVGWYEENGMIPWSCEAGLQVGDENGPIEGEFGYGELSANATIRVRGENSSEQHQKSYRIDIKSGKGEWEDQDTIVLNKCVSDPLRFTNLLSYKLLEEIPQLVSVRTRLVHLYVKDKTEGQDGKFVDYGLYTQIEQVNGTWLNNHGFDRDGQLYKADGFDWKRHEDAICLATDSHFEQSAFEQYLEIKGSDDHTKILELLDAVNNEAIPTGELLERYFDQENLAYWMAFQMLTGNAAAGELSYYLYSPQSSEKWFFLSWDHDRAFSREYDWIRGETRAQWTDGITAFTDTVLFRRILQDPGFLTALNEAVDTLRTQYLTEERIRGLADEYRALAEPYVYALPDRMYARVDQETYDILVDSMAEEVEENYGFYQESLKEPWPFHILDPVAAGDGSGILTLEWEDSYSPDGSVTYTVEVDEDFSFSSPAVSQQTKDTSIQTSLGPGQYFVRVTAENTAGSAQQAFEFYNSENNSTIYGVLCFYVFEDGTVSASRFAEE